MLRQMNSGQPRPIGIDLFSGAGGMSLGFEQAGFDVVAAVEIDPIHASAHKFNFPQCKIVARSVVGLSGVELKRAAKVENRRIDVVFGGAPCQGFSLIGHRALDDPRNALVREFVRLVSELSPSYFVFENVKGLTVGRHRCFLEELIAEFSAVGYNVACPWRVLNAAHFGVPQNRERLILLGAKKQLGVPAYPEQSTTLTGSRNSGVDITPTCADALSDLPDAECFSELLNGDSVAVGEWKQPSSYARKLRCLDNDSWGYGYPRKWDPTLLTSSMRTEHTAISRRRFAETQPGTVEPISRFFRLPAHGLSNTLRAGTDAARGAFTSPRPIHYAFPRCVTVREMARLHGFPDWFRFHETKWHGARQIGNAVPPPLARAIASKIVEALGITPTRPNETLELGSSVLLRMDMKEAASYWNVAVPIGRRDKKSGARKRKQAEIERLRIAAPSD
jgi:DNA (cytosine-5)-methyltransferase 1